METPTLETAPPSIHPPEEAIAVVGSIVYMVGVYGCVGLLLYGALNLYLFGLMIGSGVLRGKPQFRSDVEYISATSFVLGVGFLVLLGSNYLGGWPREIQNPPQTIREALLSLFVMSTLAYLWYTVRRPDVRACFESSEPPLKHPRSYMIASAAITVLLTTQLSTVRAEKEQLLDDLYFFQVTISFYDARTGEPLSAVSLDSPNLRRLAGRDDDPDEKLPQIHKSGVPGAVKSTTLLSGMSDETLSFQFSAEGYAPTTVTIDEHSEKEIRIELTPLSEASTDR